MDDTLRRDLHDGRRALRERALPRKLPLLHDGVRVGTQERGHEDELPGGVHVQRAVPAVGDARVLDAAGTFRDDRRHRDTGGAHVLLFGVRVSGGGGDKGMEDEENFGAAENAPLALWNLSGTGTFAPRLNNLGVCRLPMYLCYLHFWSEARLRGIKLGDGVIA